jgi:hypothetical protein
MPGAFGYGSVVGAILLALLLTVWPLKIGPWVQPAVAAVFSIAFVFTINLLVIAPYRAYRLLEPFKLTVISGLLETAYPIGQFEPQKVALRITNRSYQPQRECVVHIMDIEVVDNRDHKFPRFIEKFTIDSRDTKQVVLLFRAFRQAPYGNDIGITLGGPVGMGYGGNIVRLPTDRSYLVSCRIAVSDIDPIIITLKVWSDDAKLYVERV